jgi:hypothetical protein
VETSAEIGGEACPGEGVGMRAGEVQRDAAHGADHVDAEGDEGLAETRDLCPAECGVIQPELQFLKQDEGRGRQRDPELIGPEAGAARAAKREGSNRRNCSDLRRP